VNYLPAMREKESCLCQGCVVFSLSFWQHLSAVSVSYTQYSLHRQYLSSCHHDHHVFIMRRLQLQQYQINGRPFRVGHGPGYSMGQCWCSFCFGYRKLLQNLLAFLRQCDKFDRFGSLDRAPVNYWCSIVQDCWNCRTAWGMRKVFTIVCDN